MKMNRSVMSAMLGVAMLAVPITASAHTRYDDHNRGRVAAFQRAENLRGAYVPRAVFAPRVAENRFWGAPAGRYAAAPYRGYYAPAAAPNCPLPPAYNQYSNNYAPAYYPPAYNSYNTGAPAYAAPLAAYGAPLGAYGAPVGGGLANLMNQRNSAQVLYQQAVRNGNRVRAKHLLNDMIGLNKQIAGVEQRTGRGGFNPVNYNSYAPQALNNGYGYGGNNGFSSMLAPLVGNYIH